MIRRIALNIFLIIIFYTANAQNSTLAVCSWNIENFGKSKNETEIDFIATTLNNYDVVAIIEVVAGYGGAQAVAKLSDALNRKGSKWDYTISDPTSGSKSAERYAFLWKTRKLTKIGDAWLEKKYEEEIEREPFLITLKTKKKSFTLVAFHAVPKSKQPEREIKYFKFLPDRYPDTNLIFCGDFNCSQSNLVFNPLKSIGYNPIFTGQKTSLRQKCIDNDCLASEYDNIFYNSSKTTFIKSGVDHFYKNFVTMKDAKTISDHLPIFFNFRLN